MTSLLFFSKFGALGAKFLAGAAIAKAAPFVVPVVCAVACVTATIAGAKHLSKKLSSKEPVNVLIHQCTYFEDDYVDENGISDDTDINEIK